MLHQNERNEIRVQEETRDSGDREETNTSQDNNEMRFWDERALQRAPVQTLCVCVGGGAGNSARREN